MVLSHSGDNIDWNQHVGHGRVGTTQYMQDLQASQVLAGDVEEPEPVQHRVLQCPMQFVSQKQSIILYLLDM